MSGCVVRVVVMILSIRGYTDCCKAWRVCQVPAPEEFSGGTSEKGNRIDPAWFPLAAESGKCFVFRVVYVHNLIEAANSEYFPN